jgi:UDP-N-acetylglucosamine 2-epimerase
VGDVMFDAMNPFLPLKRTKDYGKYILLTIHRQENVNKDRLKNIFSGLEGMGKIYFPAHPRTKNAIQKFGLNIPKNIKLIDPVGYKKMLSLESNAKHIVTDSGGVTREAFWMQIPVTSLRAETEWPETVSTGWNTLADDNPDIIAYSVMNFSKAKTTDQPLWEFGAKKKIREVLYRYL